MRCAYCICRLLLLVVTIKSDHFRGGTVTWKPINNAVTGSEVSILVTQTYTWTKSLINCTSSMIAAHSSLINLGTRSGSSANLTCISNCSTAGGYIGNEVPITGYCTDDSDALDLTVSQRTDMVNLTVNSYFTAAFVGIGGWYPLALGSSMGWGISCRIDLHVRSDNGLINTPPVATCISYISIPVGITQTIQIPVLDADNDVVRCRFSSGSSECVNTCPPTSLPSGTSLTSSCVLTITGNTAGDYYLVAMQVEDYITNSSVTPLSTVPLQFLIYVYAVPNCTLKPLLSGSIIDNDCHGVQVGVNFTITLTATNRCGSGRLMSDIATLSFPILIKSALVQDATNSSLWSITLTWIPTATEVGSQVFCAIACDSASVQSDQYCVKFYVGLTSVPLCPGATGASTNASTTMMVTTQTSQAPNNTSVTTVITSTIIPLNGSTSTSESTNNLPLSLGLGLGLGLPLMGLLGLMASYLCCRYCPGPFWKNLRDRFGKEKNTICPECQSRYDNCSSMNGSQIHDKTSTQYRQQYISDSPPLTPSLLSNNTSLYDSSLPLFDQSPKPTRQTTNMPSRSKIITPNENIPMQLKHSIQPQYPTDGSSILVRAYVKQEGTRNISPR